MQTIRGIIDAAFNDAVTRLAQGRDEALRAFGVQPGTTTAGGTAHGRIEHRAPTAARTAGTTKPRQRKAVINRWVADNKARRVPGFVTEMTGLDSAVKIKATYGNGATFLRGKPAPAKLTPKAK